MSIASSRPLLSSYWCVLWAVARYFILINIQTMHALNREVTLSCRQCINVSLYGICLLQVLHFSSRATSSSTSGANIPYKHFEFDVRLLSHQNVEEEFIFHCYSPPCPLPIGEPTISDGAWINRIPRHRFHWEIAITHADPSRLTCPQRKNTSGLK